MLILGWVLIKPVAWLHSILEWLSFDLALRNLIHYSELRERVYRIIQPPRDTVKRLIYWVCKDVTDPGESV